MALTVLRIASREKPRPWRSETINASFDIIPPLFNKGIRTRQELYSLLDRLAPSIVVVVGYDGAIFRASARWARAHRVPCVLACESWKCSNRCLFIKELAKSFLIRLLYNGAFVAGHLAAEYLVSLGMPRERIRRGYDVVDNDQFEKGAEQVLGRADEIIKKLDLPKDYFLFCGRLAPEKNLRRLLSAFQSYSAGGGKWNLVIVGSGPQEREIKARAEALGGRVRFIPWLQLEDLTSVYALARCFILPSISEPWGLVVNEAMAAGLPVLVSRRCGCWPDLCWRGINGYDFDPIDVEAMASLMRRISSGQIDLKRMGEASRRIISNFTPETWAASLADCAETLCSRRVR